MGVRIRLRPGLLAVVPGGAAGALSGSIFLLRRLALIGGLLLRFGLGNLLLRGLLFLDLAGADVFLVGLLLGAALGGPAGLQLQPLGGTP